jgi:hypothetical protein
MPPGWTAHLVGSARIAIPDGWTTTSLGVRGATVAAWWPRPPTPGQLPTRCAVQERPRWLLSYLNGTGDFAAALQRDLDSERATTVTGIGATDIGVPRALRVRGTVAALAFTATVHGTGRRLLATADLLVALDDASEIHVFCSGPPQTLPAHVANGVDSATFG